MPHPQEIVILGCGGNSVDVLEAVEAAHAASGGPRCRCVAFLDDDSSRWGERLHGVEVSGPLARASEFPEARFVFTIGSPKSFWRRGEILERLGLPDERFETVVHPTASVSPTAELGPGTVVLPGNELFDHRPRDHPRRRSGGQWGPRLWRTCPRAPCTPACPEDFWDG